MAAARIALDKTDEDEVRRTTRPPQHVHVFPSDPIIVTAIGLDLDVGEQSVTNLRTRLADMINQIGKARNHEGFCHAFSETSPMGTESHWSLPYEFRYL